MNIIARPYGRQQCYCRPDTTWERENKDFYSPECVNDIFWAPILFVRISKAGKCIGRKFASRYYDAFNFGILLYGSDKDIAFSSCMDHTSLLPFPLYNPIVMENEDNVYEVSRDGDTIFSCNATKELIEETVCLASELTSLRIGDLVAVELAPVSILASRPDGETVLKGTFCENTLFDKKIIF